MTSSEASDPCVSKLKALADGTRLAVMESLMEGPKRVGELGDELGVEQSLLSHHLRVLREMGLLEAQRDGKAVVYTLAEGVEGGMAQRSLNLGCCQLSFPQEESES
ncbi:MAG: metalloregulator ArsR/SmtB family transcription factor [Acidobacteriota bacterium]